MKKIRLSVPWTVLLSVFIISLTLNLLFILSTSISDAYNLTAGHLVRFAMAKLTGWIPFSLGEILLYLTLPAVILIVVFSVRRGGTPRQRIGRTAARLFAVLAVIYILFVLGFASGYRGSSLDARLGLERRAVDAAELYDTITLVTDRANEAAKSVVFNDDGSSTMRMTLPELSSMLSAAYEKVFDDFDLGANFNGNVKPILASPVMTYTHISGVYSYFTGEANINTNFPDYVCVFSAAHEMAHQRGISREDEANFTAYLVCISSDDAYIRYCGYLSMYDYLAAALSSADAVLYAKAAQALSPSCRGELIAYNIFFEKYLDNIASDVSGAVNDTYLKAQGTQGTVSYGLAAELAVAYHEKY